MWDYNVHENDSVSSTPTPTAGSTPHRQHTIQRLSAVISALERSASRMDGHPKLSFSTNDTDDAVEDIDRCLVTNQRDSFDEDFVLLDCASGTHLCTSRKHAMNEQPCKRGHITGIEGPNSVGTEYDLSCEFVDPAFGRMPLATGAAANILSLATAKDDGFVAKYNNDTDQFTLVSPGGGEYTFGRINLGRQGRPKSKFYVMSLATNTTPSVSETQILYSSHRVAEQLETGVQSLTADNTDGAILMRESSISTSDTSGQKNNATTERSP